MMLKQIALFLVISLIILASSWALLSPGFFRVHDFVHGARIAEMAKALQDGHIPPRWSQNFGFGYGMPLFEFYAPLPYWVGAIFFIIGLPLVASVKLLFLLSSVFTATGGYKLGKLHYGRVGGLLASAAITLAPYRAVNLYIRGALSETWAIAAIVWILFFTYQIVNKKKNAWFGLVISLVVLFLSHNLLTLLFIPVGIVMTVAYVFLGGNQPKKSEYKSSLTQQIMIGINIALAYLLSVGVAAFYLFPAFFEKNYTKIEQYITGGYFDYHLHFVYLRQFITPFWGYGGSEWGPGDGMSFFLGVGQILGLGLFGFVVVQFLLRRKKVKITARSMGLLLVIALIVVGGVLFATQKTLMLWDSLEILTFVQFPWRTLSIVLIGVGLLVPSFILLIPSFIKRWLAAWLMLLLLLANAWMFQPESWLDNPDSLYYSNPERIRRDMSSILPDYIPAGLAEDIVPATELVQCSNCQTTILLERTHQKLILVKADRSTDIIFNVAYYPGWQAEVNGIATSLNETADGLISINVPAGESKVGLFLTDTPLRNAADIITLASLLVLMGIYLYTVYSEKQSRYEHR